MTADSLVSPLTPASRRQYYRCHDCLTTCCIEAAGQQEGVCGICGGRLDYLGHVTSSGRTYERTAVVCDCNEECQTARGPICTCRCGGANHGAGFRGHLEVIDSGQIRLTPAGDHGKAARLAKEYRAALDSARAAVRALPHFDDWKRGNWVPDRAAWLKCNDLSRLLAEARAAKQHKNRMQRLAEVERRATGRAPAPATVPDAALTGRLF